jgi:hypothetical protein
MIILLFITTFIIAFAVASIVVFIFNKPIDGILKRVVPPDISPAWAKYLRFAIYVVGIGGGVRVWDLEKYLTLQEPYTEIVQLTPARWLLEIYQTVIGTLQSTAMVLLVFFVFALIAVVMVRLFETRVASQNRNAEMITFQDQGEERSNLGQPLPTPGKNSL